MKTVIVVNGKEVWSHFRKLCKARYWSYQHLANTKRTPKIGAGVDIKGDRVERREVL